MPHDSIFGRYLHLYTSIQKGDVGPAVLDELLPSGRPLSDEKVLWDYKLEISPNDGKIFKDIVAFYNTYGDYLVIGIRNSPRSVVGFGDTFDTDLVNRQLKALTKHAIDTNFRTHSVNGTPVGLLFIPQRPDSLSPAQFLRDAPCATDDKPAYRKGHIYFRDGDECRPVSLADEYQFLCSQGRRQFAPHDQVGLSSLLDNNLGLRDPGLIRFIGRDESLRELWRWFCDPFSSPIKLLTGLGGVGKTTLAREFAEQVLHSSPVGIQNIIWLSAKQRWFDPLDGTYMPTARVDFTDTNSLLRALLLQIGYSTADRLDDLEYVELCERLLDALKVIPSFLIIDDVDSLPADEQIELFQMIVGLIVQTVGRTCAASRALLTARLTLGAAAGQRMTIRGLEKKDFCDYVEMTTSEIGLTWPYARNSRLIERFWECTQGSPAFAAGVLRLISLKVCSSLDLALQQWQGGDGEEVRRFAFEKELSALTTSQIRTLYAIAILRDTSSVELGQVLGVNDILLRDDLAELSKYHLIVQSIPVPGGGFRLAVPSSIRLMIGLFDERISDRARIRRACGTLRSGTPNRSGEVGALIHRVVALWRGDQPHEALEVARWAAGKYRDHPDLACLLGRAYLRLEQPDAKRADLAFRKAYELECRRPELVGLWIEARKIRHDWHGVVEITEMADKQERTAYNVYERCEAYYEIALAAHSAGQPRQAAEYYLLGGHEIDRAFKGNYAYGRIQE